MKRIYITAVPLQSNFLLTPKLALPANYVMNHDPRPSAYPIIPILADSVQEGDSVKVIAVRQQNEERNQNLELLRQELDELALPDCTLVDLTVPETQHKDQLLALFEQLTDELEENACYYACATFGTKTYPLVLFSALRYADRLLSHTEIKGIYYREVKRRNGVEQEYHQYDVSALFRLDSIVDMAADTDLSDKRGFVRMLLNPADPV